MALTSAQKFSALKHLGWPANTIIVGSTSYNKTVVDRLAISNADAEAKIIDLLDALESADVKLAAAQARMVVKRIGDIELNTDESISLIKDKRRLIRELSSFLDIAALASTGSIINLRL